MSDYTLGTMEARFAELIWSNEPLSSRELVAICETELDWKKSTTFTVLKRLCRKGLFQNAGGTVTSLLSREEFEARQSEEFVEERFGGSLPQFVAAFSRRKTLSDREIKELEQLIAAHRKKE